MNTTNSGDEPVSVNYAEIIGNYVIQAEVYRGLLREKISEIEMLKAEIERLKGEKQDVES